MLNERQCFQTEQQKFDKTQISNGIKINGRSLEGSFFSFDMCVEEVHGEVGLAAALSG